MFLIILFINLIVNGQHAFYSKNNLDYDQTLLSFQRIEQVTGENLENFIKKIERVDLNNIPAGYRPSGFIIVKLIIDEQGELEVAMIAQSLCPLLDSLIFLSYPRSSMIIATSGNCFVSRGGGFGGFFSGGISVDG